MSRLARKAIIVPQGIQVTVENNVLKAVKGAQSAEYALPSGVEVSVSDNTISCQQTDKKLKTAARSLLGTTYVNLANLITGLEKGFSIDLQLVGIGYSVALDGSTLVFALGKSHPDRYVIPHDVNIAIPDKTNLVISGLNKQRVSDVADEIVSFRKPDAYKGKGIRYKAQQYKLKEVKK